MKEIIMKNKKLIIIIAVIIIGVIGFFAVKMTNGGETKDEYQTIVSKNNKYTQYKFDFKDIVDDTKEYKINNHKIVFDIVSEGISSFSFNDKEKVETLAKEYDVYYLSKIDSVIIVNHSDFATDMYFANNEGISNLSDVVKGAYTFKNIDIENNVLKFDVERWSKDYVITTEDSIFSIYFDDYTQYVNDDYPVELSYKYDLKNKEFNYDKFEITTIKTIKDLYDEILSDDSINLEQSEIEINREEIEEKDVEVIIE